MSNKNNLEEELRAYLRFYEYQNGCYPGYLYLTKREIWSLSQFEFTTFDDSIKHTFMGVPIVLRDEEVYRI